MHQNDFAKIEKMNIQSNVLFANQSDSTWYVKKDFDGHSAEIITTHTHGSGNNRNILLIHASADICLLADDDVTYYAGYKDKVLAAFSRHPDADMIVFNLDSRGKGREMRIIGCERRMHWWERNPYGSVRVAFRLNSQRKYNIWFSNLLGAGARYGSGEDTLFINEFRRRGKVYLCDEFLGVVDFSTSTWFSGYDEKYFFNQGAKIAAIYPRLKWFYGLYYAVKTPSQEVSFGDKLKLMIDGFRDYMGQ